MGDVPADLVTQQRTQVVAGGDALVQLAQLRTREQRLELRLADEHYAQQLAFVGFQVGEQAQLLAPLMQDADTYFYVCGLKAMETGVLDAMSDICSLNDLNWDAVGADMQRQNRLHFETY